MLGLQWTFSLRLAGHFTGARLLTCQWRAVLLLQSLESIRRAAPARRLWLCAAGIFRLRRMARGCAAQNSARRGADFYALLRQFRNGPARSAAAAGHHYRTGYLCQALELASYDPARAAMLACPGRASGAGTAGQRLSKAIAPGMTLTQGWRS